MKRSSCIVCGVPLMQYVGPGRPKTYCSQSCINVLNSAYATNAYIDRRNFTECVNCSARLIPPWTSKKKWCSRVCSQAGWYRSVAQSEEKRKTRRNIINKAVCRRKVLKAFTGNEIFWLRKIKAGESVSKHAQRKLRLKLDLNSSRDLSRYARSISSL